jgi:hypothetical protein
VGGPGLAFEIWANPPEVWKFQFAFRQRKSWALCAPKVIKNGSYSATAVPGSTALPFVISTEAQRSGQICGSFGQYSHTSLAQSDRLIGNFLVLGVPVEPLATPVRLCGHDAHDRVGETVVNCGIWLFARLHRL